MMMSHAVLVMAALFWILMLVPASSLAINRTLKYSPTVCTRIERAIYRSLSEKLNEQTNSI